MAASNAPTTEEQTAEIKTTDRELDAKMPASVMAFGAALEASTGRVFTCPECGEASCGRCTSCGYTHTAFRSDK